jgi:hypothetical protein
MDLGAFRTPDGQMQGAATKAVSLHIVEEPSHGDSLRSHGLRRA